MRLRFLGAADTVTGSRTLVETEDSKILVDCGLFQGFKNHRLRNWQPFPIAPSDLDAVILTHAHLDHSGYIPLLVKNGFIGPVYCSAATKDLCGILLPDSGYLQEEEAKFANKRGFSKHHPALPLYTRQEAERSLDSLVGIEWKKRHSIGHSKNMTFELIPAGHLLGAASVVVRQGGKTLIFSGDLGRKNDPLLCAPQCDIDADFLVIESTYGNRRHPKEDSKESLRSIICKTFDRRGVLLIPSFAVGRAQLVLHCIYELLKAGKIPQQPIFLNSPMAAHANDVLVKHASETKISSESMKDICNTATIVGSVEESKALNEKVGPMIIIAASGMATGGRVLHHLKAFAPKPENTLLFVGFQAGGTRGEAILQGVEEIKIHGEYWPVKAEVVQLDSLSAHADADELLEWVATLHAKPRTIFVNHGEPAASDNLRRRLEERFHVDAIVPEQGQEFDLNKI